MQRVCNVASDVLVCYSVYVISQIGVHDVETSIVANARAVFLLSATTEEPGIIFGYRASIVNTDAMLVLQLWRPLPSSNATGSDGSAEQSFRLVDEVYYSPDSEGKKDVSQTSLLAVLHVSAVVDEPARCATSRQTCCEQRWTLSVINLLQN